LPDTYQPEDAPPQFQELVRRLGPPVGIEEARSRWSALVAAATTGTITLITRQGPGYPQWTALVPLAEVHDPLADCPVHTLLTARKTLGDLIDTAANAWGHGRAQLITKRGALVAALIPAAALAGRGEPVSVEQLLYKGGTVTLTYYPGVDGATNEDGDVVVDPEPDGFEAVATDIDGNRIGTGCGNTVADALRITRREPWGEDSAEPAPYPYSDEPPF
jgi:antitoxin (DNA-binding transcriptional repressor) of toxin-antitoxin stability system